MVEFQNAVPAYDLPRANELARDIRITPRQLHDEGGGAAEAALVGGIIVLLLAIVLSSDSPSPPPRPPRPVGPEGGVPPTDAGADG